VAYRETVTKKVESVEYRHIKQSGGSGQFAVVKITVEPSGVGNGYIFEDEITGGRIPREYIQPTNQGIQSALDNGVLAGYPTVDVKVSLVGHDRLEDDRTGHACGLARPQAWPVRSSSSRSWPSKS
jgi:elongation factor G